MDKKCETCKHWNGSELISNNDIPCWECYHTLELFDHTFPSWEKDEDVKFTNGDKIRAMSDEDLAEFICDRTDCPLCDANEYCTTKDGPSNGLLKWLKMEATR